MITLMTTFHIIVCVLLTIIVLLQYGKGAEAGAFSSTGGASQSIFSSSTKGNFLTKATAFLALCFMVTSISLSILHNKEHRESVLDGSADAINVKLNSDAAKTKSPLQAPAAESKSPEKSATEKNAPEKH